MKEYLYILRDKSWTYSNYKSWMSFPRAQNLPQNGMSQSHYGSDMYVKHKCFTKAWKSREGYVDLSDLAQLTYFLGMFGLTITEYYGSNSSNDFCQIINKAIWIAELIDLK